jgi:hypothetical protein
MDGAGVNSEMFLLPTRAIARAGVRRSVSGTSLAGLRIVWVGVSTVAAPITGVRLRVWANRYGQCGCAAGATLTIFPAEGQSLTAREAMREALASEHAGVLRGSVAMMVRDMMEREVGQGRRSG